jgi:hypothetical protein
MIRQAHTYLVGALSGTVVIGAAIAVFVVLVSAQVFTSWPASFGQSSPDKTEVSDARAVVHAPADGTAPSPAAVLKALAATNAATRGGSRAGSHPGDSAGAKRPGAGSPSSGSHVAAATTDSPVTGEGPGPGAPESTGGGGSSGGPSGTETGAPHAPSSPTPGSPTEPVKPTPTGGGSGGGGGGGSGGGGGEAPTNPEPISTPTTSKGVTEAVNEVVHGVDETVTGGAVGETGVTHVTEEVVNGVAGPESVVGKTVDGVGGAVGGLLGGGK